MPATLSIIAGEDTLLNKMGGMRSYFSFLVGILLTGVVYGQSQFIYEQAPFPECHASTIAETPKGLVAAWFGGTEERNPDVSMWMAPGGSPTKSTGEMKNEMILGGRYLKSTNTGNFMGQPFEGIGITAYDNAKKMYINTWIDNMGTGIMTLTGAWDAATNSVNFTGNMVDPASGKDVPVREVIKMIDDNHQTMEMYASMGGQEVKTMEIKFTRK